MKNIVKYCSACQERFSKKFSFCPNCASALTDFELNSVVTEQPKISEIFESSELVSNNSNVAGLPVNDLVEVQKNTARPKYDDGIYHLALVEDKNNSVRHSLLLGAFVLVTFGTFAGVIISIFTTSLNIGAINDDILMVYLSSQDPDKIDDDQLPQAKKKHKSSGGGDGGSEDLNPASKGRDAKMLENPMISPSVKLNPLTNPEIKIQPAVKGPETDYKEDKTQPYGIKNSIYTVPSDGTDGTSGQGVGGKGGQGDGNGPGIGRGNDGGKGGGKDGGIGPDDGPGIATRKANEIDIELPPPAKKVTIAMKVLSKPKATYTDDARQNAVQGTVTLRVTFLANGSIGAVTVVGGLPNGLTEQAIAAARSMKFEPQKINGVAQTVTRQVQYTFTLF